jgi:hypothetical protein
VGNQDGGRRRVRWRAGFERALTSWDWRWAFASKQDGKPAEGAGQRAKYSEEIDILRDHGLPR